MRTHLQFQYNDVHFSRLECVHHADEAGMAHHPHVDVLLVRLLLALLGRYPQALGGGVLIVIAEHQVDVAMRTPINYSNSIPYEIREQRDRFSNAPRIRPVNCSRSESWAC